MKFSTYLDIEIVGLSGIQKLVELEISEQINEHAKAKFTIYIKPNFGREQFCIDNSGKDVCINVNKELIFCGYVSRMQDIENEKFHLCEIELSSYSRKLDCREKSRSYQNVSLSYEEVVKMALKDYDNAFVIWGNSGKSVIESPLFQYGETDWEFIKRLSSTQGKSVITNVYVTQPYLMIDITDCQYNTEEKYRYLECGLIENSIDSYHKIECANNYPMGSKLNIAEGSFTIIRKITKIIEAELRFIYFLAKIETIAQKEIYNTKLVGLQLAGNVTEVIEDKIKVELDIDKEWGRTGEFYFDWKPLSSNIMYAMPEKNERVHLRLGDIRGKMVSVINCLRQNGDTCADTIDASCKLMQYENKKMKLAPDRVDFSSLVDEEVLEVLSLIDVDGIFAQVKGQMSMAVQKEMMIHSKTGKVTVTTPFQIVLRDSIGDSDAEIAINQTIECQGDVVKVKADARIEYPTIDDAPVEIKRDWGKVLGKVLAAVAVVVVVAAVAATVAALAAFTGGAALAVVGAAAAKAAAGVAIGALIGGGVTTAIGFGVQGISDIKNGVKRDFLDYIYQGVDNFCTGAMIAAPLSTSWILPVQLLGVGFSSFTYQMVDRGLDEKYGGDFYDEDSNMFMNIIFDVAFAGLGSAITKGLNKAVNKVVHMPKSGYKTIAKFLNKFFGKNYPTDQAHINELKVIFREPLKKVQNFLSSKWMTYFVLGGKEGIPGTDIPTSLFTDSGANPLFGWLVGNVGDYVSTEECEEYYGDYSRIIYEEDEFYVIDFDENGNLIFE